MRPYVYQVFDHARFRADDDDAIYGGKVYQNDVLRPAYQQAYREYFREARRNDIPIATARAFFNLPAHTSVVDPVLYGITNCNVPVEVRLRPSNGSVAATFTLGTPVSVHKTGHGLANGTMVFCGGFTGGASEILDLNGAWPITVTDSDHFTLNGTRFVNGAGTEVAGVYSTANGGWGDALDRAIDIPDLGIDLNAGGRYAWYRNAIYLNPSTRDQQLMLIYEVSGDAPRLLHQEIPIDDSLDFLATRTIALAMQAKGDPRADALLIESVGDSFHDGTVGGLLESLIHGEAIAKHNIEIRRPPFRGRRTSPYFF